MLPVVTVVLYFGTERHWNSKKNIKSLMEIPVHLDKFVNDYQMHVFEVAWLTEEQISHFHSDFRIVANFFANKRKNKDYIPDDPTEIKYVDEVLKLLQVMTGDKRYKEIFSKKKEGVRSMCDVAERLEKMGWEKGIQQGMEQGIERGIEQGMKQGIQQGNIQKSVKIYRNLLKRGFGEEEAREIAEIPETMSISDVRGTL